MTETVGGRSCLSLSDTLPSSARPTGPGCASCRLAAATLLSPLLPSACKYPRASRARPKPRGRELWRPRPHCPHLLARTVGVGAHRTQQKGKGRRPMPQTQPSSQSNEPVSRHIGVTMGSQDWGQELGPHQGVPGPSPQAASATMEAGLYHVLGAGGVAAGLPGPESWRRLLVSCPLRPDETQGSVLTWQCPEPAPSSWRRDSSRWEPHLSGSQDPALGGAGGRKD